MEHVQYLVDESGEKTAIVIPIRGNETALEEFLEDIYGHNIIEQRAQEPTLSEEELLFHVAHRREAYR